MNMRILLTGKNGQVGSELVRLLSRVGEVTAVGHGELDLARPEAIRRFITQSRPDLIINAAAYTAVDQAENEESLARAINGDAPAVIAEEAKKIGAFLIHYGTDYVFDGTKRSPYSEDDSTNPLSVYGRTKLAGEEAIRASGVPHLILRTAWVYATSGKNFLLTILRLASSREELRIVNDQFGAPTWARSIAEATARLISAPASYLAERTGTYHLTAAGVTTWYEFTVAILDAVANGSHHPQPSGASTMRVQTENRVAAPYAAWLLAATGGRPFIAKRVVPIPTQDYPTPARRPAYSVLSNARFASTFGFSLPDWQDQLSHAISS